MSLKMKFGVQFPYGNSILQCRREFKRLDISVSKPHTTQDIRDVKSTSARAAVRRNAAILKLIRATDHILLPQKTS